ncbi:ComEC/Rec2 family competence protein [Candidatus Babeliales bacterium]|nr:ComEC/Rec2 family competence protein [Candidatus Babeliales bacterium]
MTQSFNFLSLSLPFSMIPLIGVIAGIICAETHFLFLSLISFSLMFPLLILKKRTLFVPLSFFLCGFYIGSARIIILKKSYKSEILTLSAGTPVLIKEIIKTGNAHWPYRISLKKTDFFGNTFFAYSKKRPEGEIDDTVKCPSFFLKQPIDSDFLRYLFKEGSVGTVFVQEFCPALINRPFFSWARWSHNKKEALLASLKQKCSPPTFSFFCSLFIGDKKQVNYLTEKYKPLFKEWGISHHMARSGLHLIIFIILWQLLLSMIPLSFLKKHGILFALCLFYFLLTPSSISFVRAFFLFVFYKICIFCSWEIHAIHLLCIVALCTLINNPFQLFFLDFQLSFFLTFCLSWLAHLNQQR